MRIMYLDCSSGISGDMFLSACIDAGFRLNDLKREISKLGLKGIALSTKTEQRHHIPGKRLIIEFRDPVPYLSPSGVKKIIKKSPLTSGVKDRALKIFESLCHAEQRVHKKRGDVRLHELGHPDTMIDIVGAAIVIEKWEIEKIYFSRVTFGSGIIHGHHILPIPSPASLELLKGIPSRFSEIDGELITPTGAAILAGMGVYCPEPVLKVNRIGYGFGSRLIKGIPNALRIIVGDEALTFGRDNVILIETAIDDSAPIVYTYIYETLLEMGVLDVYMTGIFMKKNRPGHLLTVILPDHLLKKVSEFLFRETGTIGLRYYSADRLLLDRKSRKVHTRYGDVDVKICGRDKDIYKMSPEYESCRKIAKKKRVPLMKIYDAAKKAAVIIACMVMFCTGVSFCDTVYLKDGSEVKGIVVENYTDRIVLSTEHGETDIRKGEIKKTQYDLMEQNLVSMAERAKSRGEYQKAYFYYDKARKINPEFKEAVEGINYVSGYLFRKEEAKKTDHVNWLQDVQSFQRKKSISTGEPAMQKLKMNVGMEIESADGKSIVVSKVFSGMPARKAGVRKGDVIASVWNQLTGYMSSEDVAREIVKRESLEMRIQIDREVEIEPYTLGFPESNLVFEGLVLQNIAEGSTAYKRGLRNGDQVMSVDGKNIRYTPLKDVVTMLNSGPQNVVIRRALTIWRKEGL